MTATFQNTKIGIQPSGAVDFTGNQSMGGSRLTNMADSVSAQDAATRADVIAFANGLSPKAAVVTATGGALPNGTWVYANGAAGVGATMTAGNTGALAAQSGHVLEAGERFLIKDQAGALQKQNGIYTCTTKGATGVKAVFTRATDCDTAAENVSGTSCYVTGSDSTLRGSQWIETTAPAVMGTDPIVFTQGAAGLSQTAPTTIGTVNVGTEYAAAHGDHSHAGATVAQGATADAALPRAGGAMSGPIAMGGQQIDGIADATIDTGVPSKLQMDTAVATKLGLHAKADTAGVADSATGSSGSCTGNAATATTANAVANGGLTDLAPAVAVESIITPYVTTAAALCVAVPFTTPSATGTVGFVTDRKYEIVGADVRKITANGGNAADALDVLVGGVSIFGAACSLFGKQPGQSVDPLPFDPTKLVIASGSTVTITGTNGGAGGDAAVRGWLRLCPVA